MLVTARLKYIVEHEWGKKRYLDMSKLEKMDELKGKAEGQKRTGPRTAKSICERIFTVPSMKLVCELHRRAKRSNDRRIKAHIALSLARISQLKERARDNRQVSQFLRIDSYAYFPSAFLSIRTADAGKTVLTAFLA